MIDGIVKIATLEDIFQLLMPIRFDDLTRFFEGLISGEQAGQKTTSEPESVDAQYIQNRLEKGGYDFQDAKLSHIILHHRYDSGKEVQQVDAFFSPNSGLVKSLSFHTYREVADIVFSSFLDRYLREIESQQLQPPYYAVTNAFSYPMIKRSLESKGLFVENLRRRGEDTTILRH